MSGGAFDIEQFVIDGEEYTFKVDRTDAEILKYSDEEGDSDTVDAKVWFISQLDGEVNRNFSCIYLIVQQSCADQQSCSTAKADQQSCTNTGLIQGFTNKFMCSGYRVGERVRLDKAIF